MCTDPSSTRFTDAASAPRRTDTPASRNDSTTSSPANGSARGSTPSRASIVTEAPSPANAVAISAATTPPPMMARRSGTALVAAASRLVHGVASRSPSMSGTSAPVPVATTTACRAVSTVVAPSSPVTSTTRVELIRPCPRYSEIPAWSSQDACPSSFQFEAKESRRPSTAATSRSPVTASRAPGTCRAAWSAAPLRSSAFVGMHAQ